jgi:hypothetical protein
MCNRCKGLTDLNAALARGVMRVYASAGEEAPRRCTTTNVFRFLPAQETCEAFTRDPRATLPTHARAHISYRLIPRGEERSTRISCRPFSTRTRSGTRFRRVHHTVYASRCYCRGSVGKSYHIVHTTQIYYNGFCIPATALSFKV